MIKTAQDALDQLDKDAVIQYIRDHPDDWTGKALATCVHKMPDGEVWKIALSIIPTPKPKDVMQDKVDRSKADFVKKLEGLLANCDTQEEIDDVKAILFDVKGQTDSLVTKREGEV